MDAPNKPKAQPKAKPKATLRTQRQHAGSLAEAKAAQYLVAKGYNVLAQNYKISRHEIDLITQLDTTIIFVEVKYRDNNGLGYPEQMVSNTQIKSVHKAALVYLESCQHLGPVRYDIIAITGQADAQEIIHLEDAF